MIKKTITIATMLIVSAALIWAVWEGNAAAGSREDFPSGLFAASDLFPKYTLIEITNLEQNTISRAVIIGNMGSDGLLVKVSPDLAEALAIKEGNTVRVRVSVPPLVAEEGADPVLLGKVEEKQPAPTATPAKPAKENSQSIPAEEPVQTETEEPMSPIAEVEEPVQPQQQPALTAKEGKDEPLAVKKVVPIQPSAERESEEIILPVAEVSEPISPKPDIVPAPAAVSEVTEPTQPLVQTEDTVEDGPVLAVAPISQQSEQETDEFSDDYTKPVPEVSIPIEPEAEPEVVEKTEEIAEPVISDKGESEDNAECLTDEPELFAAEPENKISSEEVAEPQDEPEIVVAAEALPEKDSTENEVVEHHVMLVPTEPRVPNTEDLPLPKEPEKSVQPASPVVTQVAEESYTANVLTKGSFYVQVGQFKDALNVESFVQVYGKQYPIAIEKSSTAKDVFYKVYVGPILKDERGAILETFQKLGFKDAFLKKAP